MPDRPYRNHSNKTLREIRAVTQAYRDNTYKLFAEERRHAPGSESMQTLSKSYDHLTNTLIQIEAEFDARRTERRTKRPI
ncbi:hypothetical protein [Micromonospora sp. NPDC004704]